MELEKLTKPQLRKVVKYLSLETPKTITKKQLVKHIRKHIHGGDVPKLKIPDLSVPDDPNQPTLYKLDDHSDVNFNDTKTPEVQLKKLGVMTTADILKQANRKDLTKDQIVQSDIGLLQNAYQRYSSQVSTAQSDARKAKIRQNAYNQALAQFEKNPYAANDLEPRNAIMADGSIDPAIDGYNRALAYASKSIPTNIDNRTRIGISNTNTNTNTLNGGKLRKVKGGDIRISNNNENTNTLSSSGSSGGDPLSFIGLGMKKKSPYNKFVMMLYKDFKDLSNNERIKEIARIWKACKDKNSKELPKHSKYRKLYKQVHKGAEGGMMRKVQNAASSVVKTPAIEVVQVDNVLTLEIDRAFHTHAIDDNYKAGERIYICNSNREVRIPTFALTLHYRLILVEFNGNIKTLFIEHKSDFTRILAIAKNNLLGEKEFVLKWEIPVPDVDTTRLKTEYTPKINKDLNEAAQRYLERIEGVKYPKHLESPAHPDMPQRALLPKTPNPYDTPAGAAAAAASPATPYMHREARP